jgi:hypothetical protein
MHLFIPLYTHTVAAMLARSGGGVLACSAQVARLRSEVGLVGCIGALHARAVELVVARLAREARVALAADIWEVVLHICLMVSSIQTEELQQSIEVLHGRGAGDACVGFNRRVPQARVAR